MIGGTGDNPDPLSLDVRDEVSDLIYKARSIAVVIRYVDSSGGLPTDALPGACWAIEGMLDRISHLLGISTQAA